MIRPLWLCNRFLAMLESLKVQFVAAATITSLFPLQPIDASEPPYLVCDGEPDYTHIRQLYDSSDLTLFWSGPKKIHYKSAQVPEGSEFLTSSQVLRKSKLESKHSVLVIVLHDTKNHYLLIPFDKDDEQLADLRVMNRKLSRFIRELKYQHSLVVGFGQNRSRKSCFYVLRDSQ